MKWLLKILGIGSEQPDQLPATPQKEKLDDSLEISVSVKISKPSGETPVFSSKRVRELWEQIQPISNKEHPFLDSEYSPSSLMPATDYSMWVADWLAHDDWESINEFLNFITYEHQLTALGSTFKTYPYSKFISASDSLLRELKAIAILCYRIPWSGSKGSQIHLLSELFLHSLAAHPFKLNESSLEHLQRGANNLIKKQNKEAEEYGGGSRETIKIAELRENMEFNPSSVGICFANYPVTFRACIKYSIIRGSPVSGAIRPQLQGEYGLRQFGLSSKLNADYIDHSGVFKAPDDLSKLAKLLQKKDLLEIGFASGVKVMKSWKKDRIIDSLLESPAASQIIARRASRELIQVEEGRKSGFDQWITDVHKLRNIALCLATA